jgi:hypothetical protein
MVDAQLLQPRAHTQIKPLQATNVTNLQHVNNSVNVCRHNTTLRDTYIQRQLTRFDSKRDLADSGIGEMQLQFLLCNNTQTRRINPRVKINNQSYLVVVLVHRLETTTKSAVSSSGHSHGPNSDKNQATSYRAACKRCYNSRQAKSKR